jgi:hypothetical protein
MLPRLDAPAKRLPYTTADMSERLAKRKAEQEAAAQAQANQALRFGVTNPPVVKKDEPWYKDALGAVGGAAKTGFGAVAGAVNTLAATPIDIADEAVQGLERLVGVKPTDKFDPASIGSYNLLGETYRAIDNAANYTAGNIAAIPGFGKPSSSPFMDTLRSKGVAEAIAEPFVHAVNVGSVAYPASKMAVGAKLPGTIADAYRQRLLERDIAAQNNLFPAVQRPANVIDVDALQGSRLPARVVDAPAPPSTRLAQAQTTRALSPSVQRALPPAITADMAEQLARAQARQTTHFGTVSKQPIETMKSNEFPHIEDARSGRKQTYSFPVYEINGNKVAFGNTEMGDFSPGFNAQGVEVVPVNPYTITGLDKTSVEGQNFARLFFDANQGLALEDVSEKNVGQVSALTYAASRGDNVAAQELQRLANVGNEYLTAKNIKETNDFLATKQWNEPGYWERNSGALVTVGREADGYTRIQRPLEIDDMFLVHETTYKPLVDANRNIILKPAGDYIPIDPATGKQMVDAQTGKSLSNPDRDNLHFSMNHLVKGHMSRPTPVGGSYVIVVPLRDVLNANPGSLDNLYAVDTYLTPKPGQGLTIPMQSGRVINAPSDQMENLVDRALDEVGKLHNQRPDYETLKIEGGTHYSHTPDVDDRITQNAGQMIPQEYPEYVGGVRTGPHTSSIHWWLQQFENSLNPANGKKYLARHDYSDLSPNAKLRVFDSNTNKFTTGTLDTIEQMIESL